MSIIKRILAPSVVCAAVACAMVAFAQDDLDNLLKDLESDGKKPAAETAPAAPAAAEPVAAPAATESADRKSVV